ncbi:MAG: leucyl aminopeptidase family protein, partial [Burkholderiaceae bacterium]
MDFSIKTFDAKNQAAQVKTGCIVVAVFENRKLSAAAQQLDGKGAITAAVKSGDISGKPGSTLLLRNVAGVAAERVLLVGLGKEAPVGEKDFLAAIQATVRALVSVGSTDATLALPLNDIKDRDSAWALRSTVLAARESLYRSDSLKSNKEAASNGAKKLAFIVDAAESVEAKAILGQAVALANGMELTKNLGNLPANVCTPTYLADTAKRLGKEFKLDVEVLDRKQLQALKMGSFLSVTNGSEEPPKFIVLKHLGGKAKDAPIVLVGKGITFDSGGISIK